MQQISYKDRATFLKELFDFLRERKVPNLKIPQIGGKELDLLALYTAVVKRGGAENVSNKKLWKEIVNEFDLPPSCTSASFTLKNHYQKYLLAYEQKVYFQKDESEIITELARLRNSRRHTDSTPQVQKYEVRRRNDNLEKSLIQHYNEKKQQQNHEILCVEQKRMIPSTAEVRRIILAFESKLPDEIRFSLNSLLLYSVSRQTPFFLYNYKVVWHGFVSYFSYVLKMKKYSEDYCLDGKFRESNIIQNIKKDQSNNILHGNEYLLQLKMMLSIIRNLLMVQQNQKEIEQNNKLKIQLFHLLLHNNNYELNRLCLEIFGVLSKFLLVEETEKVHQKYLNKIILSLNSDIEEEKELAVLNLHNLMMNQENEQEIENLLEQFIYPLVKLLTTTSLLTLEKVLEIICHFSDLKMATRIIFAKQQNFFYNLIALISGNSVKNVKFAKLSAVILENISITPGTRSYLKPYEQELFLIASTDDNVSSLLSNVLLRIKDLKVNEEKNYTKFQTEILNEIESLQLIYLQ